MKCLCIFAVFFSVLNNFRLHLKMKTFTTAHCLMCRVIRVYGRIVRMTTMMTIKLRATGPMMQFPAFLMSYSVNNGE